MVVISHDIEASLRVASLDCNYLSLIMKFTGNELFGFWETDGSRKPPLLFDLPALRRLQRYMYMEIVEIIVVYSLYSVHYL